ncbi:MBL fold metallo-hydrolase [Streptomyces sp. NBC_01591]|uniref:MBL fold metallo-hydrolase n=1 Tax=Streptomyces sp. NBC_01591 TaxID=2975888 RepID=UPI002DD80539|nr:MBL fold metallo-hydrolase [Streptomyces sp. NBC_01591]WSD66514.1 MBL fold metallo-hydrolase [Streptomyces sp. NBC_01591]
MSPQPSLPSWLTWWQRPFPDSNTLLLHGRQPALVDTGFVAHAEETAAWARAHAGTVDLVVNTHWHSDHVGGNALLQAGGVGIAAGAPEAEAISRRDPGCCAAEYLDQPVAPYTVDVPLEDGQALRLGETDWEVIRTPGHTPGHLALWQPEERLLVVGDALSDYDVGWVNLALDGLDAAATALASLKRLADLAPRVILPSHGPIPTDPDAALAAALRRAQRLVDDPDGAVWYGARRIFAFALMIRDGIPAAGVEPYLHARAWLTDAARLLDVTPEVLAAELVTTMLRSGALVLRDGLLHAAAEHATVDGTALRVPYPRAWPAVAPG